MSLRGKAIKIKPARRLLISHPQCLNISKCLDDAVVLDLTIGSRINDVGNCVRFICI